VPTCFAVGEAHGRQFQKIAEHGKEMP
jgi:hypothetical protein